MDQAMEQVKEIIRWMVKYRFWISVSIAALFAVTAYFVGSGAVQDKTKKETDAIIGAKKDVEKYAGPSVPTEQYKPLVDEKTAVATKDVNKAWKLLYQRQAPYLN